MAGTQGKPVREARIEPFPAGRRVNPARSEASGRRRRTCGGLEGEALEAERLAAYDPDPVEEVMIGGELFRVRQSEIKETAALAVEETERWFMQQKEFLDEETYLKLLVTYEEWKGANRWR